jgi:hypothetical protein
MSTIDTTTTLTVDEAREITQKIRQSVSVAVIQIKKAWLGRAWVALGYASWEDYKNAEFGEHIRLPRDERQQVVGELRAAGMSMPAIASATGSSVGTVHADIGRLSELKASSRDESVVPEVIDEKEVVQNIGTIPNTVIGLDGKRYAAKKKVPTSKPRRSPLIDTADNAGWKLRKVAESWQRIATDDRYHANRVAIAQRVRSHLDFAIEVLTQLEHELAMAELEDEVLR